MPIEIAPNDKLLLMANRREPGFRATNGELVTVSRIDEQGRIHLQDGRTLPENYKQFTHGYAVTAHRSQGKSVDAVVISADGMRKELFYVAASRGRESITVVTSDKELLRQTIACSDIRESASDLARKARLQCVEHNAPTLRDRYQGYSGAREQERGVAERGNQLSKDTSIGQTSQQIDQDRATCQPTHEQVPEPSHSLGMSR